MSLYDPKLSDKLKEEVTLYIEQGIRPSMGVEGVITNDLYKVTLASSSYRTFTFHDFYDIAEWFICRAPANCMGDSVNFENWMLKGGHEGIYNRSFFQEEKKAVDNNARSLTPPTTEF